MTSMPPPGYGPPAYVGPSYMPADPGPGLQPLSRRLLKVAAALSVLLILLVLTAWLRAGGGLNPIAQAAERTRLHPGARSAIVAVYTSPALARPLLAHGHGVYNGQTGRSRVTLTMQAPLPLGTVKIEAVGNGRIDYLRSKQILGSLPQGKRWMGVGHFISNSSETALAEGGDTKGVLESLRAASGDVETVGRGRVRGVPTTRYRGTMDLERYADTLSGEGKEGAARQYRKLADLMPSPTAVEAWVDRHGLLRRTRIVMPIPKLRPGPPMSMNMQIDFFDFGIKPVVRLPAADRVFDVTPLARAELHMLGAGPRHVATGAPLSASSFKSRAQAICQGLRWRERKLRRRARPTFRTLTRVGRQVRAGERTPRSLLGPMRTVSLMYSEPAVRAGKRGLRRLGRLAPPSGRTDAFRRFVRISAQEAELGLAETRAAELGDFEAVKRFSRLLHRFSRRGDRSGRQAGLPRSCLDKK